MTTLLERELNRDAGPPARPPAGRQTRTRFLPIANVTAWVVFLGTALAVQPATDPSTPIDPISMLISTLLFAAILVAGTGLAGRSRYGYAATGAGGVLLGLAAVSCFAGGHTGAWVLIQGLSGLGLATVGAASWRTGI